MYHRVWIALWCLWPLIVFLGGQGAAPLIFLLGIFGAISTWPYARPPNYVLCGLLFLLWVALSSFWSPTSGGLIVWRPETSTFAIGEAAMRIALITVMAGFAIYGALKLRPEHGSAVLGVARYALFASTGLILFTAAISHLDMETVTVWFVSPDGGGLARIPPFGAFRDYLMSRPAETVQNIERHMMLYVLSLPLLLALIMPKEGPFRPVILCLTGVFFLLLAEEVWAHAALLAIIAIFAGGYAVYLIGMRVFRYLGNFSAGCVAFVPLLASLLPDVTGRFADTLPPSAYARIESWRYVAAKFWEKPVFGWGIDASKSWRETHEAGTGILAGVRLVPGHPHNMFLQVVAETGIIGGLLAAGAFVFLGNRLSQLDHVSERVAMAMAALWLGALVYMFLSFSVWNDAFWGALAFMTTGLVALHKREATI